MLRWIVLTLMLAAFAACLAPTAFAVDGVLEINQTCAVATGCFSGDTASFPVTVDGTAGHSVRLTSDLTLTTSGTDAIQITADDVTVDLNGFAIRGITVCSGAPVIGCTNSGTGSGVNSTGQRTEVRNGTIAGQGRLGVNLEGTQNQVRDLRVTSCGQGGVETRENSVITRNVIAMNGGTPTPSDEAGILAGLGSVISDNSVRGNAGHGIHSLERILVLGNAVSQNGLDGIRCKFGGCRFSRNLSTGNTGYGLAGGPNDAYDNNSVVDNLTGTVLSLSPGFPSHNAGGNFCSGAGTGSASCP